MAGGEVRLLRICTLSGCVREGLDEWAGACGHEHASRVSDAAEAAEALRRAREPIQGPACPGCKSGAPMTPLEVEEKGANLSPDCPQGLGRHQERGVASGWRCARGHRLIGKLFMQCPCGWKARPEVGGGLQC